MGSEAMMGCDVSDLDGETIAAMIILFYREDCFCGCEERFPKCAPIGAFAPLLGSFSRLTEKQ